MIKVKVELKETSQAIEYDDVENTYTKGPFYCIYVPSVNRVFKHPHSSIFRTTENFGNHGRTQN